MAVKPPKETDLYQPVKDLLEGQGYEVKGEIGAADIVAVRGTEEPVIVELKTSFSLSLFHQGIDRLKLSDLVYVCVPRGKGKPFLKALKKNTTLCRRLGLGLITVRQKDGFAQIHLDPAPYQPRKNEKKKQHLLKEFAKRVGDPNPGGSTRVGLITAYRQDALKCLCAVNKLGPTKASQVSKITKAENARNIMSDNHYGWFERVDKGIYQMTPNGKNALKEYKAEVKKLKPAILSEIKTLSSKDAVNA